MNISGKKLVIIAIVILIVLVCGYGLLNSNSKKINPEPEFQQEINEEINIINNNENNTDNVAAPQIQEREEIDVESVPQSDVKVPEIG